MRIRNFQKLDPAAIGGDYHILLEEQVDSTNRVVKELAQQGAAEGTVLFAEYQTAGRGRLGRSFFSPAGSGLYFTVLLRPAGAAVDALKLTVAAGLAVAEAVEQVMGLALKIKWVNDLYLGDKKVCGILAEGALRPEGGLAYCALGIGLNVFAPEDGFGELSSIAGALSEQPQDGLRERLARAILDRFFVSYRNLEDPALLAGYRKRSYLQGKTVTAVRGAERIRGQVVGIGEGAELLLRVGDEVL
ncbi:MAG: biotin--[Clostridia bacterium]|nr:biotin--[acetyl-CoA-carboxylase] ligase [Clostridia bacterium]